MCALVGQIKNCIFSVLHKIPRIVTELFDQPAVMFKFDIQRYLVYIMLRRVFFILIVDIIPFQRTDNYTKETLQYTAHSNSGIQIFQIS